LLNGPDALFFRLLAVDCSVLLTRQLNEIVILAGRLRRCRARHAAIPLHRQLCGRGALHVQARERVLLPAWQRAGWKDLPANALEAHVWFKRTLAQLMVAPPGSPDFAGSVAAFLRAARAQRDRDETVLVPAVRAAMQLADRRSVFDEIEQLYDSYQPGADTEPVLPDKPPAQALVEEAELVLNALAARPPQTA
jgi:hypothetical protein